MCKDCGSGSHFGWILCLKMDWKEIKQQLVEDECETCGNWSYCPYCMDEIRVINWGDSSLTQPHPLDNEKLVKVTIRSCY